ncbi:MAG: dicarboxylate/amino acid:cation symporter [Nitrospira sp.]|nr:dicarboxylate/amino acid:cation symporter [Nitrospira sp.]
MKLHWKIALAIVAALVAGHLTPVESDLFKVYDFLGTLFLNALKMIIVPLIVSSIICSVSGLGEGDHLGRLGGKTLIYYAASSLLAILVGLAVVNITTPGISDGKPAGAQLNLGTDKAALQKALSRIEGRGSGDIVDIFLRIVPKNIFAAAHETQMLGLIFFSILFGVFMTRISGQYQTTLQHFWHGVADTMVAITMFIMQFAPIGVFGLIAETVSATGFGAFKPVLGFFLTVVVSLALHTFVILPLALSALGRVKPVRHFQAMAPAMLTAFSTASSSATLPLTMECVRDRAGVSRSTSSFVLPLGATVNMDGTALYECVAAMFIAQAYGLDLSLATQFTIVLVALLTSIGVAGIPAASLVAIVVILAAVGLPPEGIGILMITDRILDMMRTAVNVFSDSCAAVIIARSEGETEVLKGETEVPKE